MGRALGGAGASSIYDRYGSGSGSGGARADGRPWAAGAGRRALTPSLARRF